MLVDMSIWASLLGKGKKIGFVNKSVVDYRIHDLQMCSIKNHKTVNTRSYYESMAYCNIFYKINDIPMVKFICKTFPFNKKVLAGDEKYIPFIVAYTYLKSRVSSYQISGYLKIHELFSDDEMRQEIENKFGFGIKEFREIYSKPRLCNADKKPNLVKQCILLLINFLNILSLGYLKKKKKKTLRPM